MKRRSRKKQSIGNKRRAVQIPGNRLKQQQKRKGFSLFRIFEKNIPVTVQQSIPYKAIYRDGICKVTANYYSMTIAYEDINYQLAQNEDKVSIFENYCDFLNYYDSTIQVQLTFFNSRANMEEYTKNIHIPLQEDGFDEIRKEYSSILERQMNKGNNGLEKVKYITLGIKAQNIRSARARLERIVTDSINNFKVLGVKSRALNGKERLEILYRMMNEEHKEPFHFDFSMLAKTGMSTKDFIAPPSMGFGQKREFQLGGVTGSTSYLQILAPELTDRMLAEFLNVEENITINMHLQSMDQAEAIKTIKRKISDVDKMKIEEQKKAVRSGYDMDIIPSDLNTYGKEAKNLLEELQSRNERMFLVTIVFLSIDKNRKKLENMMFQVRSIAQKYNCMLRPLDYQQEAGFVSSLPLGLNKIEIRRGLTTSAAAIFIPFTTQELFQKGEALYYGLNALSNNLIMVDRKRLKNPKGLILGTDLYAILKNNPNPKAQRIATCLDIYVNGSLNIFNHRTNVDIKNRIVCFDIKKLGKQLKKLGMLVVQDQVWNRVTLNREIKKSTRFYQDEFHLMLKDEQTASYSVEIWKRFRKWGGIPTGITQNVKDLLASREIENIFENSDFIYMLNQASGDRKILAKALNISPHQLSYVSNSAEGEGLLFYGDVIIPFFDHIPKDSKLYKIMTTKPSEVA